jgi:hypothetical protein
MDGRRGEVNNSCGKLKVTVEMHTLTSDRKHMPRMFTERREDD